MIPLITSIPPRFSRFQNGTEVGSEYRKRCISSWSEAGFAPYSLHSARETPPNDVTSLTVARDALEITGRPHIYMQDMIARGSELARGGAFAITNSDIILHRDLGEATANLAKGNALISHRIDIKDMDSRSGFPMSLGFDFLAMHGADVADLPDIGLIFGAPWWDNWLPIFMHERGIRFHQPAHPIYHLLHEANWSQELMQRLGVIFIERAKPLITDARLLASHVEAIRSPTLFSAIRMAIAMRLPSRRDKHIRTNLRTIGKVNIRKIDEVSVI